MKKAIILQHGGGELTNQLWNFISIYAYSLEKGYECQNYSFFEYNNCFRIPVKNKLINFIFFNPFRNRVERRSGYLTKILRNIYKIYVVFVRIFYRSRIISSRNTKNEISYLFPTPVKNEVFSDLEKDKGVIYFDGWLFRNPVGITKYRKEIVNYFKPNPKIEKSVREFIKSLRKRYNYIVGLHIRQGDYKTFKGGKYFIEQERVRQIIDEYMSFFKKDSLETCFVITSDGKIEEKYFKGLNYVISDKNAVEDLFILSATDIIIGSDSSFGDFAAYYSDIPHIIFKKEKIDWDYYTGKDKYFQNKYCAMVQY
jgi:hypothetical protein